MTVDILVGTQGVWVFPERRARGHRGIKPPARDLRERPGIRLTLYDANVAHAFGLMACSLPTKGLLPRNDAAQPGAPRREQQSGGPHHKGIGTQAPQSASRQAVNPCSGSQITAKSSEIGRRKAAPSKSAAMCSGFRDVWKVASDRLVLRGTAHTAPAATSALKKTPGPSLRKLQS